MPTIPNNINDISIEFFPNVNRSVDQKIIDALQFVLSMDVAAGYFQ